MHCTVLFYPFTITSFCGTHMAICVCDPHPSCHSLWSYLFLSHLSLYLYPCLSFSLSIPFSLTPSLGSISLPKLSSGQIILNVDSQQQRTTSWTTKVRNKKNHMQSYTPKSIKDSHHADLSSCQVFIDNVQDKLVWPKTHVWESITTRRAQ